MLTIVHDVSPIYVRTSDLPETRTRKALVRAFLTNRGYPTYSNLLCTQVQCEANRNRSVTEIHQIVLSRFPKTTFEAILKIVKELIDEDGCFYLTYCSMIKKVVVLYLSAARSSYISDHGRKNHYNVKGLDGYSIEEYENVINNLKK